MWLKNVKGNINKLCSKAACVAVSACSILLNKIYAQADLIIEDPNMEYAREENVTTALDIIIIVMIAALVVIGIFGIYRMKKKAKQDELDNETRMIQNKKEQDL